MRRWVPWLVAAVLWNGSFDLQVRRVGETFTAEQLGRWRGGQSPSLIQDAFLPRIRAAAWRSTALAGLALLVGLGLTRRSARGANR
jgi:hypothetical protein